MPLQGKGKDGVIKQFLSPVRFRSASTELVAACAEGGGAAESEGRGHAVQVDHGFVAADDFES